MRTVIGLLTLPWRARRALHDLERSADATVAGLQDMIEDMGWTK